MAGNSEPHRRVVAVVDDQPFIAKLIEVNLAKDPLDLVYYRDPLEALARLTVSPVDLLIVDIRMPQISGLEFCQRVRAMPAVAGVPIIILTAQGETATEAECVRAGATAFMTKPFSPKGLSSKVRELLEAAPGGVAP